MPPRAALRGGVAAASRPLVRVVDVSDADSAHGYCECCAGPIAFGAVMRGGSVFCSVECSLEGPNKTA